MNCPDDPAAATLARLGTQEEFCGIEPPRMMTDDRGREWQFDDCWCTRPPLHDGDCLCEVCHARYGAPGWPSQRTDTP